MAFPTTQASKAALDQGTDSPATARAELADLVDAVNAIITSYAQALGICDLDANGKIPAARLPGGVGSGTDADLLDGEHGSFYRSASNMNAGTLPGARFADVSHGNRGNGALHAVATQALAGFHSATDKAAHDLLVTGKSTGINGYQRLPSGIIIQWGAATVGGANDIDLTFPYAFPNACRAMVVTGDASISGATGGAASYLKINAKNASGATVEYTVGNAAYQYGFTYLAIGY